MPWHISNKKEGCSGFAVVKDDNNEIVGCHKTKAEAVAHMRALYASENKSVWAGSLIKNIKNGKIK